MNELRRWAEMDVWGSPAWRWALGLGIAAVCFFVFLALRRLVVGRITKMVEKARAAAPEEHTRLNDFVLEPLKGLHGFFLFVLSLYIGASACPITPEVQHGINTAMVIASLLQLGFVAQRITASVTARWLASRSEASSATLAAGLRFAARVVIWSVVVLLVLSNLGVEISTLIAGLGVGGVAAALAVQNVLGDLFASLALYFDRPFDIGDFIVVGNDNGNVLHIGMRSTRVRSLSGEEIVFPNADLMQSRIHNYRRMSERRVVLEIGVLYGTKTELLREAVQILKDVIGKAENVRLDRAHFKGFGASSLDLEAVYFVLDRDYTIFMNCQEAINLEIMSRFEKAGLDFAFPTRTLHLETIPEALSDALGKNGAGRAIDGAKGRQAERSDGPRGGSPAE